MTEEYMEKEQIARRWKVRRRFAIIAFAEIIGSPIWVTLLVKATDKDFAIGIFGTLIFSLMTIVLAYIGGVLADDNLNKWRDK